MQPNELRIENYVNYFGKWCKVRDIKREWNAEYYIYAVGYNNCSMLNRADAFDPIPLTPELLDKVNFQQGGVVFDMGEYYLEDWTGRKVGNPLRYLHELQNLYFAIYGNELELSL